MLVCLRVNRGSQTMSFNDEIQNDESDDEQKTRRDFIQKFGKFAAITPIAMSALISPQTSAVTQSVRDQRRAERRTERRLLRCETRGGTNC